MRSYKIGFFVVTAIIAAVMAIILSASSGEREKYDGGTLVWASESVHAYALVDDREAVGDDEVYAFASGEYVKCNITGEALVQEEDFIKCKFYEGAEVRKPTV